MVCVCGRVNRLLNPEPGEKLWKFPAEVQSGPAAHVALAGWEAPGGREAVQPCKPPWLLRARVRIAGQQNSPTPPPEPPQVGWEPGQAEAASRAASYPSSPSSPSSSGRLGFASQYLQAKKVFTAGLFFFFSFS